MYALKCTVSGISLGSPVIPGDYLSVISCYYQVLVEVPRPTTARGIRLGLGLSLGLGLRVRLRHIHRLMRGPRS